MPDAARQPLPLVVHGRPGCEDTAVVRDRLGVLGISFAETDVDEDPAAAAVVEAISGGSRSTPTLVFGDDLLRIVEPTVEALDDILRRAGWVVRPPRSLRVQGRAAGRPLPAQPLGIAGGPRVGGVMPSIETFGAGRPLVVFLAHDAACLACAGYARQLARRADEMADSGGLPLFVLPEGTDVGSGGPRQTVAAWAAAQVPDSDVLADRGGRWKRLVADRLGIDALGVALLLVDRSRVPRMLAAAAEAGGLIGSQEVTEELRAMAASDRVL